MLTSECANVAGWGGDPRQGRAGALENGPLSAGEDSWMRRFGAAVQGCACTSATECAVGCYAEHPADDTAIDDCAGLAVGRCVGYQVLGHWCTFDDGVATEIYIDPT